MVRGDDGLEYGPVDLDELREWVRENRAGLGTDVRLDETGASWHPWQSYPELVALLAEAHATSPVPGIPGLVLAPMGRRIAAFALDLVLIFFIWTPVWTALAFALMPDFLGEVVAASLAHLTPPQMPLHDYVITSLVFDSIVAFYFGGFQAAHGQTPAKALLRLRVVDQFGQKPSLVKSLLRALVLVFCMGLFFLPLAYAFLNPQRRALHDFVADTCVVEA